MNREALVIFHAKDRLLQTHLRGSIFSCDPYRMDFAMGASAGANIVVNPTKNGRV